MEKIVAAFDGLQYSNSTKDYAIYLANQTNTHLVGVFMDDLSYTSYKIYELVAKQGVSEEKLKQFEAKDIATRNASAANFAKACQDAKIQFSIHHDRNIALHELKHESVYTDLLVIDAKETLTHYEEKQPTRFIRELLADVHCPVVLVPQKFIPIKKIILLYDGEPASVHAIKMFSYLLPEFSQLETQIVSVNPVKSSLHLPDNKLMKEFMKRHYPKVKYKVLKGSAETEIVKYLKGETGEVLVVTGANRRGSVSRMFRESMADILMQKLKLPIFVAHSK